MNTENGPQENKNSDATPASLPLVFGVPAVVLGYLGVGLPFHFYQFLFSALTLLLLYHRKLLNKETSGINIVTAIINYAVLCLFYKLMIGGGIQHPFNWLKVPGIEKAAEQSWWDKLVPSYEFAWKGVADITDWGFDLTRLQTLLLLAILGGVLARFQSFSSLCAVTLLLVSVPTYAGFNWDMVILFLVAGGLSFYFQISANTR